MFLWWFKSSSSAPPSHLIGILNQMILGTQEYLLAINHRCVLLLMWPTHIGDAVRGHFMEDRKAVTNTLRTWSKWHQSVAFKCKHNGVVLFCSHFWGVKRDCGIILRGAAAWEKMPPTLLPPGPSSALELGRRVIPFQVSFDLISYGICNQV